VAEVLKATPVPEHLGSENQIVNGDINARRINAWPYLRDLVQWIVLAGTWRKSYKVIGIFRGASAFAECGEQSIFA